MSIKGFKLTDNTTEKYDYYSLDNLPYITEDLFGITSGEEIEYENGYIACNNVVIDRTDVHSDSNYMHAVVQCQQGDLFLVNVIGANAAKPWAFIDSNGNRLSVFLENPQFECDMTIVTAPVNSAYFITNYRKDLTVNPFAYKYITAPIGKPLTVDKSLILPQNTDFDDIKIAGNYRVNTYSNANTMINIPIKTSGRLNVMYGADTASPIQFFYSTSGSAYYRTFAGGSWTDWNNITASSYVSKYADLLAFDKGAVKISANSDLDTYQTPGNYYVASYADSQTMSHMPFTSAGRLTVKTINNASSILQKYVATSLQTGGVFMACRLYSSGSWTDWNSVAYTSYVSKYADLLAFDKGAVKISANSDLDTYQTPGNYYVASYADSQTMSHMPFTSAGRLTVKTINNAQAILQEYVATSIQTGGVFMACRLRASGSWTDWSPLATDNYVINSVSKYADLLAFDKGAVKISANSDLDTYQTPGNYYVASYADSQTMSHMPFTSAGRLTVKTINNAQAILQEYVATSIQTGGVFMACRLRASGSWTDWTTPFTSSTSDKRYRDSIVLYDKMSLAGISQAINTIRKASTYSVEFANAPSPMWLVNYAGNTQNCHPKVLYFENGFGGHKYWMAYTPYPYCDDDYENPCIAYSDDGYSFTNISGNPLDDPLGVGFNSDTELVYNNNTEKMEVWWRYVNSSTPQETIYRMTTSDGLTWSNKELVQNNATSDTNKLLSPCVIYESGVYKIWVCTYQNGIKYYEAQESNITNWVHIRDIPFTITDEGITVLPWHMDVIKENGEYIMAIMFRNGTSIANNICSVFVTTSSDNITYSTPHKVISGNVGVWDKVLYRPCIVKVPGGYRLYYTGGTGGYTSIYGESRWGLGVSESNNLTNFYGVCKDTRVINFN